MTWDGVPWVIGGGAEHSPEVARLAIYAAMGGAEGVVGVDDCKVVPLNVPGAGFRVLAGGVVIANKAAGGGQQTYVARNPDDDTVMFTPTGSGGGRTDLVAVVVEDPEYAGQPTPTDLAHGPYVRTKLYTNVSPTVTKLADVDPTQTGYALAKYTLGVSDGTLQAADITDLRKRTNVPDDQKPVSTPQAAAIAAVQTSADAKLPLANIHAGTVNVSVSNSGGGSATLNYPDFASTPTVVVSSRTNDNYIATASTTTPQSCVVTVRHRDNTVASTTVTVSWIAVAVS